MRSRSPIAVTSSSSWAWPRTISAPLFFRRRRPRWQARPRRPSTSARRARAVFASSPGTSLAASASVRPTSRAVRKLLASISAEAGRPIGTSMMRFSTTPPSVTSTTRARPGPRWTNSICCSGRSVFGAMTRPAQRDRPRQQRGRLLQHFGPNCGPGCGALRVDDRRARRGSGRRARAARRRTGAGQLGRQPAGRGVRRIEQPGLLQVGHDVADGRRRQLQARSPRDRARADRLAGLDIGIDDVAEDLARAIAELALPAWCRAANVVTGPPTVNVANRRKARSTVAGRRGCRRV